MEKYLVRVENNLLSYICAILSDYIELFRIIEHICMLVNVDWLDKV